MRGLPDDVWITPVARADKLQQVAVRIADIRIRREGEWQAMLFDHGHGCGIHRHVLQADGNLRIGRRQDHIRLAAANLEEDRPQIGRRRYRAAPYLSEWPAE